MIVRLTKDEKNKINASEKLIYLYRQFPTLAAKDLLGVDLVWFQRLTLRSLWFKKYNLVLMGRGIGKTWLLGLFAVLYAMLHPGARIGVITPSFKQTQFLFDKIQDFYDASAFFRASTSKRPSRTTFKELVVFRNGAQIEGLPVGTGEKIRGRRYNIILVDEYAFVDEDIIKRVVRPMMNVKKKGVENKYIISSTAYYTWNHFYHQYLLYNLMSKKKPNLYGLHEYIYEDLKMIKDPPYELDDDVYDMMKMDSTKEIFSMENFCEFPLENVGFFSPRLIDQCTPRINEKQKECPIEVEGDPNGIYTMGIDAARAEGGDNFSISLIKINCGVKQLVHVFTDNGISYQLMIYHIRRLLNLFNVVQINCDAGGGGTTIKDLLTQPYQSLSGDVYPPVLDMDDKAFDHKNGDHILRMVKFTKPVVNDLYMRLKADMQHRSIEFPLDIRKHGDKEIEKIGNEIIKTKRELLVLQAEGKGNYFSFDVPSQFKKDRATSLSLAVQAANEFMSTDKEEKAEIAEGFWI